MDGYNESTATGFRCGQYANDIGCIVNCPVDFSQIRNGSVCELGLLVGDDNVVLLYNANTARDRKINKWERTQTYNIL